MKKTIILLCALYLILAYGTALGESPTAAALSEIKATLADIKAALNNIPPAWSKKLQCDTTACPRFELVMGGEAVLDHETGLVWEQSPSDFNSVWYDAKVICYQLTKGNRKGWRLPDVTELASLVDPSAKPGPTLPAGHPFSAPNFTYWSALSADSWAVVVMFDRLYDIDIVRSFDKGMTFGAWCVRGGQGVEAQFVE